MVGVSRLLALMNNNPWLQATQQPPAPVQEPEWLTDKVKQSLNLYHFPHTQDGMLMLHKKTKENLDYIKEKEMEYRKICTAFLVPDAQRNEGMNNVELGNGYVAKVGIKFNYKLAENDKVWEGLDKIKAIGNQGAFIAERLVSWTPNFLVTEYRTLQEEAEKGSLQAQDMLKIVSEFLTITDAAPTLEIKEPKAKRK